MIRMRNTLRILMISNSRISSKECLPITTGIHYFHRPREMARSILSTAGRRIKMHGERKESSNSWFKFALKMLQSQLAHFSSKALLIRSLNLNSWPKSPTYTNSLMRTVKTVREMAELDGNNSKRFEDQQKTQHSVHSALRRALLRAADYSE